MRKYFLSVLLALYAAMPLMAGETIPEPGDPDFIGPLTEEQTE